MILLSLIPCYTFILCAFFLVHFYLLPSLGNSYLSFKIPSKYHFLWETFLVSQTELKDPPPCPDSCLCISTPAPPMLYTTHVKWICLLTVETSLRLETIFSSFYSQQLTQSLAHGNCSISVCWVNKWVDGWVDEWRDAQTPSAIPFPSIPWLHPSLSFLPKAMNTALPLSSQSHTLTQGQSSSGLLWPFFPCTCLWTIKYSLRISFSRAAAAAAAKSLQSCPTLWDPIDGSPPGSAFPGILQARTLEWVAISFSNAWQWKVKVKSLSCVRLLGTPWTAAHQAPPSMGFSRQEYWSGLPLPSPSPGLATHKESPWVIFSHFQSYIFSISQPRNQKKNAPCLCLSSASFPYTALEK